MFIEGKSIGFRQLEREDLAQARDWRNDPRTRESFREYRPLNMTNQEKWFESLGDNNIMFMIVSKCSMKPIGVCGLCYIDRQNRSAEVSWYMGNQDGVSREVVKILLDYGFKELGLHRIFAEVYNFAEDRITLLKEIGFHKDGIIRDAVFRHNRFWNSTMLSILEGEWK